jgi:DtxR family Mn-dependent transcriptional regulator
MGLPEQAEEILEWLWSRTVERNADVAEWAGANDEAALEILAQGGYIERDGSRLKLTDRGRDEARGCVRRHRLAERLVNDVLNVKSSDVHETGCAFEHLLHKGLDDSICTLLGHPARCPHGRPIPRGRCCAQASSRVERVVLPMTELKVGSTAVISYLRAPARDSLRKLIAMGLLPETPIRLVQRFPAFVFETGKSQFAVDKHLASQVFVRRAAP